MPGHMRPKVVFYIHPSLSKLSTRVSLLVNVHVGRRSSSGPEATTGGGEGAQKKPRVLGPALPPLPQRDEPEQKVREELFCVPSIIILQ